MSFILGILAMGALLAAVFGRRVGAMFVTGAEMLVVGDDGLPPTAKILRLTPGHDLYTPWRNVFTHLRDHKAKMTGVTSPEHTTS